MNCEDWHSGVLKDICDITMGQSPSGEYCNTIGQGAPLLNGPTEFGISSPIAVQYTTNVKRKSEKDDILFCVRGSTTGRMNWSDKSYAIGRGLAAIHHKKGSEYKGFVKGLLEYKLPTMLNSANGSTFPNITKDILFDLLIPIPSSSEQKAIAATLSCLDDKIELNNQMNDTLEQMAQAIFKSWFVDFEPFQDGEFEDSELGKIPKGWKVKPLYDSAEFINGTSFKKDEYSTSGIPIIKISELKNGITDTTQYFDGERDGKYYLQTGDMLFSWSGSPQTSIDTFIWVGNKAVLNQHTFKIKILNNDYSFVYLLLKFFKSKFIRIAMGKQTTGLGHVTVKDLKQIYFPYDKETVESFTIMINPLITTYIGNLIENKRLSSLRDALLPKLMSGEIRVPVELAE